MPSLKTVIFLLPALLALPLRGDSLTDLRATLSGLQGHSLVTGSADYSFYTQTRDGGDRREEDGRIRVGFRADPSGLRLEFSEATLEEAEREQRARRSDPDKAAPTRTALFSFTPLQISEAVDFGAILLRELGNARLIQATRSGTETVLTLQLPPRLSRTERKHVRNEDIRMTIRLDGEGIPIAAERTIRIKARFFIISLENNRTDSWTLARRGDRLMAIRRDELETSAGLTREITIRSSTVLTIAPGG